MVKFSSLDIFILASIIIATVLLLILSLIYAFSDLLAFGYDGPSNENKISINQLLVGRNS